MTCVLRLSCLSGNRAERKSPRQRKHQGEQRCWDDFLFAHCQEVFKQTFFPAVCYVLCFCMVFCLPGISWFSCHVCFELGCMKRLSQKWGSKDYWQTFRRIFRSPPGASWTRSDQCPSTSDGPARQKRTLTDFLLGWLPASIAALLASRVSRD